MELEPLESYLILAGIAIVCFIVGFLAASLGQLIDYLLDKHRKQTMILNRPGQKVLSRK